MAGTNTIYALQINGETVLVLSALDGDKELLRFTVDKVGGAFARKDVAKPGDSVFFVRLNIPANLR